MPETHPSCNRVVVVHGAPDRHFVDVLHSCGLEQVVVCGDVSTWAPARASVAEATEPAADHALAIDVNDAATRLGVSRSTVYRLVEAGELDTVHLCRSVRIPVASLEKLVAAGAANRQRAGVDSSSVIVGGPDRKAS